MAMAATTEKAIADHLNTEHEGWTLEGLQRMVQGQRIQELFGLGPSEMFR